MAEIGSWELADPRLAALLDGYALSYGLDPQHAPAGTALLPYMEETFGSWYVSGGMRALAQAVYERCLARKVEFVFGAEVARVLEKDGRAAGVELTDGTVAEAAHVVLGARPHPGLMPAQELWQDGDVTVQPRPEGSAPTGRFMVLLSLRGARSADAVHRTLVHPADGAAEHEALSGEPARRAPHGDGAAPRRSLDPPRRGPRGRDADGDRRPARPGGLDGRGVAGAVRGHPDRHGERGRARSAGPHPAQGGADARGVRGRDGRTGRRGPRARAGGVGGGWLHAGNRTRLPGLLLAGGWSHPGGGPAHAGMSGALVAGIIVEGDGFRGSR